VSNLVIPDEAKINWAQAQIDDVPTLSDCFLRLYKGFLVIDRDTTLAELEAVQADFVGYAPIALGNWSDAVIVESAAMTEADIVTYEATEDDEENVYGCYATNVAGDKLWFASPFTDVVPTPFSVPLEVSVELDLNSLFLP